MNATSLINIAPIPQSQLSLYRTYNADTPAYMVTIGEYIVYHLTITLPEGTTLSPSVSIQLPAHLGLINATVASLPSTFNATTFTIDTQPNAANFSCPALVNQPDNVFDSNDQVVLEITTLVLASSVNTEQLPITSQFTFQNGTATLTESQRSLSVTVVQPALSWSVTWDETSGDAGDQVDCTIVVQHAASSSAAADDVMITAQLSPYFNLIAGSVESTFSSVVITPAVQKPGCLGIAYLPTLKLGDTAIITFSTLLDISVRASSTISNVLAADYSSAYVGGQNLYLVFYYLFWVKMF